jgi:hypothetical protein
LIDSFLKGRCPSATVLVNIQLLDLKNVTFTDLLNESPGKN